MADCRLFQEDEVYQTNEGQRVWGLILENSSYPDSSDDERDYDDDDDDDDASGRLKQGQVRVAWFPDGKEEVVEEDHVVLDDRSLMPGDVVRRDLQSGNSQRGYVRDVQVRADVQICDTNLKLCNIDASEMQAMQKFEVDCDVALGSWLGQVRRVEEELTLRFTDGAKVVMKDEDAQELDQVNRRRRIREGTEFDTAPWYRGQKLSGSLSLFRDVDWVKRTKRHNPDATRPGKKTVRVIIEQVRLILLEVHWVCRGFTASDDPHARVEAPPRTVKGNDLNDIKRISCFEHCSIQLGDPNLYVLKESDLHQLNSSPPSPSTVEPLVNGAANGHASPSSIDALNSQTSCDNHRTASSDAAVQADAAAGDREVDAAGGVAPSENDAGELKTETGVAAGDNAETTPQGETNLTNGSTTSAKDDDDEDDYDDCEEDEDATVEDDDASSTASAGFVHAKRKSGAVLAKARRFRIRGTSGGSEGKAKLAKDEKDKMGKVALDLSVGKEICVEVTRTQSLVDVVWQDGSVEYEIPSTQLYPIHHLDEQEYFPGDFCAKGESTVADVYGVVQRGDHRERTCRVRWFKPYHPGQGQTSPTYLEDEECSVYDLKDHSDFGYRPGSLVIRISGFDTDNDASVGQVVEILMDGRLKVTWSNGRSSFCFPQDLFLCSDDFYSVFGDGSDDEWEEEDEENDDEEEDDDDDNEVSDQSWETESEDSDWEREELTTEEEAASRREKADLAKAIRASLREMVKTNPEITVECVGAGDALEVEEDVEETVDDAGTEFSMLPSTRHKLVDALKKGKASLKRLDQIFSERAARLHTQEMPGVEVSFVFKEILHVFNCCRDMDRLMETSFFNETLFDGHLAEIRKRLRQLKQDKIASRVLARLEIQGGAVPSQKKPEVNETGGESGDATSESSAAPVVVPANPKDPADSEAQTQTDHNASAEPEVPSATASIQLYPPDDSSPEMTEVWTLCSKVCSLLTTNMSQAMTEISKRVDDQKCDDDDDEDDASAVASPDGDISAAGSADADASAASAAGSEAAESPAEKPVDDLVADNDVSDSGLTEATPPPALADIEAFRTLEHAPETHIFHAKPTVPLDQRSFGAAVRKDLKLLSTSLPDGIFVRSFEDRMDLFSFLIVGPSKTPYEDGLFLFDAQLPLDYPKSPPIFHYVSYCSERLNPNLYEDGKVCVSLLGTWNGKGNEVWNSRSSLLQVLVSIQGLILVAEPYYNEAGYERQKGSQIGAENSRMYNEMAVLKMAQHMAKMGRESLWREEVGSEVVEGGVWSEVISHHLRINGKRVLRRYEALLDEERPVGGPAGEKETGSVESRPSLGYSLLPASKGFKLSLKLAVNSLSEVIAKSTAEIESPAR